MSFRWSWWVTLTFDREVGSLEASALLERFLRELEVRSADTLSCLIVKEQKHYSGLGKPAGTIHFHLLVSSTADLSVEVFKEYWERPPYGGERTSGPSAHVQRYDQSRSPTYCIFKTLRESPDNWELRRPEIMSPTRPASWHTSAGTRRSIRHQEARDREARRCGRSRKSAELPAGVELAIPPALSTVLRS